MKFLSIIFALLFATAMTNAQTNNTNTTPAMAALTPGVTESYVPSYSQEEQDGSQLVLTTDKKINAVKVVDEAGDVVMSSSASGRESVKFNLRKLQKGLYYIHIYCEGEKIVRKFLRK
jgi:hypothetical protein